MVKKKEKEIDKREEGLEPKKAKHVLTIVCCGNKPQVPSGHSRISNDY